MSQSINDRFDQYVAMTLKDLTQSIDDAKATFHGNQGAKIKSRSSNWELLQVTEDVLESEVLVWVQVGTERLEIVPGGYEARIKARALVAALEEIRQMITAFEDDNSSETAKAFMEIVRRQS